MANTCVARVAAITNVYKLSIATAFIVALPFDVSGHSNSVPLVGHGQTEPRYVFLLFRVPFADALCFLFQQLTTSRIT